MAPHRKAPEVCRRKVGGFFGREIWIKENPFWEFVGKKIVLWEKKGVV